jgi:hypothetical protein
MTQALKVVLFALLIVCLPSQLVILVEDPGNYPYILAAKRQSAAVKEAMRYHGTTEAYSDGTNWYFHNEDGKVCRLFTAACQSTVAGRSDKAS